ncbi:MAG: hypothetical protein C5B57_12435 [Blastocatellia bacterium]|nr:MAG: hypothetical protein C5B57_12435 [Blastocatellia bacterium]
MAADFQGFGLSSAMIRRRTSKNRYRMSKDPVSRQQEFCRDRLATRADMLKSSDASTERT